MKTIGYVKIIINFPSFTAIDIMLRSCRKTLKKKTIAKSHNFLAFERFLCRL